jgi:hypothetical protein
MINMALGFGLASQVGMVALPGLGPQVPLNPIDLGSMAVFFGWAGCLTVVALTVVIIALMAIARPRRHPPAGVMSVPVDEYAEAA